MNVRPRRGHQPKVRLGCALVLLSAAVMATAATASEPPGAILVLTGGNARTNSSARETVLVDALRIYTRDLGRAVRLGAAAPTELTADALDRVAADARLQGADVVVWFGERAGVPLLYALKVASLELRETAVARDDTLGSARVTALKVRALVAPTVDDTQWAVPPEAPPPRAETTPATTTPATTTPATTTPATTTPATTTPATTTPPPTTSAPPTVVTPPPIVAPPATVKAAPIVPLALPQRERRAWLELTTAYQLIVPTNIDWLRQGLVVRLTLPWGRLPLAAFVDGAFTSAPEVAVDSATIGARIWPVGVGIVARLVRPRWHLAIGPRASLQIIEADAREGTRTGSAQRLSAGVGVHAEGAWLFSRYVGAIVALGGEALLPRQQLSAGGPPDATDLGWVQFTVTAGLLLRVP